jgi:putative FmdB family regulatory protein
MPLYEYKCPVCSFQIELIRTYEKRDDPVPDCEYCGEGSKLTKTLTFPNVTLVGEGWTNSK